MCNMRIWWLLSDTQYDGDGNVSMQPSLPPLAPNLLTLLSMCDWMWSLAPGLKSGDSLASLRKADVYRCRAGSGGTHQIDIANIAATSLHA